jgi:DNA-binding transcriptional LysR family regulator
MKRDVAEYETLVDNVLDLRAFALAVDLRSLTAAAKILGESKATVSRRLSRLEAALGTSLLRRSPRLVEPTDDGLAYRVRVREILELLGDANAAVRGARAAPSGQLRITVPPGLDDVLAPAVARFAHAYPEVMVSTLIASRLVDLDAEHVDVALRATARLPDSSFVAHRLAAMDLIAVAAPSYLAEHPAPRRVEDLAAHRFVQFGELRGSSTLRLHRVDSGEDVEVRLRPATAASDVSFAKELVVAGAGISVLPRVTVQHDVDEGRLVNVLPAYLTPGVGLYLLYGGGRFLSPKVRAFRDFMIKSFGDAPPRRRKAPR